MRHRYTGAVPFQPGITQKVKQALYDSGHEDLVAGILDSSLKEIEADADAMRKRIVALELERVKWVTETGVNRIIDGRFQKTTSTLAIKLIFALGGALLTAAVAVLGRKLWN